MLNGIFQKEIVSQIKSKKNQKANEKWPGYDCKFRKPQSDCQGKDSDTCRKQNNKQMYQSFVLQPFDFFHMPKQNFLRISPGIQLILYPGLMGAAPFFDIDSERIFM